MEAICIIYTKRNLSIEKIYLTLCQANQPAQSGAN